MPKRIEELWTLYVPRHPDAPQKGNGLPYLPNATLDVAERIQQGWGKSYRLIDGNIGDERDPIFEENVVGISVTGSFDIAKAVEDINRIRVANDREIQLVLGGQGIKYLTDDQFSTIFGKDVYHGKDLQTLKHVLKASLKPPLSNWEEVSRKKAYTDMPEEYLRAYLGREICLDLSQGCGFECTFCAADKAQKETYRSPDHIEEELDFLIQKSIEFGYTKLDIYLSNLDTFQTPKLLEIHADRIIKVRKKYPDFQLNIRGLSTTLSFLDAFKRRRHVVNKMLETGLINIGFGVDAVDATVAGDLKKTHSKEDEAREAVRITREILGITPAILMVLGAPTDTPETLLKNVCFAQQLAQQYQADLRPYVMKSILPGIKEAWEDPQFAGIVEFLIRHPERFAQLNYVSLATPLTHPWAGRRMIDCINAAYVRLTASPRNTTKPVFTEAFSFEEDMDDNERKLLEDARKAFQIPDISAKTKKDFLKTLDEEAYDN